MKKNELGRRTEIRRFHRPKQNLPPPPSSEAALIPIQDTGVRYDLAATRRGKHDNQISRRQIAEHLLQLLQIRDRFETRRPCAEFADRLLSTQQQLSEDGRFDLVQTDPLIGVMPNFFDTPVSLNDCDGP